MELFSRARLGLVVVAAQPAAAVPDEAPGEGSASAAAKQGNKPVLVRSKTDETTEVWAILKGSEGVAIMRRANARLFKPDG